ncbi:DUF6799 domain-containing protein [Hymenobacter rubidus]|uniref:DUF6799 domain-containing protein n=1 Tax=Hymenobacter rubidus TaxID=1441626 RepID=UPI00192039E6|nr:DUF6799 domain-containing protein [Hymenobacter rubidus]
MLFLLKGLRGKVVGCAGLLLLLLPAWARAQQPNNDGFQRRNGQMQVVRNGQPRPMTRDAHLPTGATVTKDGFIVSPSGQRTELREGQGCDLRGRPVAVRTTAAGTLALATATRPAPAPVRAVPAREGLFGLFGRGNDDDSPGFFKGKKHKKKHGKGRGHWKDD